MLYTIPFMKSFRKSNAFVVAGNWLPEDGQTDVSGEGKENDTESQEELSGPYSIVLSVKT